MVASKVLNEWTFGYVKPFLSWIMIVASWSGIIQIKNNHFWMNASFCFLGTTWYYLIIWIIWTPFSTPPSKSQHLRSFWDIYLSKKGSWSKAHQRNQAIQDLNWPDPCDFVKSENPGVPRFCRTSHSNFKSKIMEKRTLEPSRHQDTFYLFLVWRSLSGPRVRINFFLGQIHQGFPKTRPGFHDPAIAATIRIPHPWRWKLPSNKKKQVFFKDLPSDCQTSTKNMWRWNLASHYFSPHVWFVKHNGPLFRDVFHACDLQVAAENPI